MTLSRPRMLLALVCALALAGFALLDAARNSLTELNPALAARLPGSDDAKVALVAQSLGRPDRMPTKDEVFATARERLRHEPLDPAALNVMAYVSDPDIKSGAGARYADLATQVSKRTTFSQLTMTWAMLQSGKVTGAMERFDAVLRAHPDARSVLLPYLKQALKQPGARIAIADLAAQDSPWVMDFLGSASQDPAFAGLAAETMLRAGNRIPADDRAVYAAPMLARALQNRDHEAARKLLALIPGADPGLFTSTALTHGSLDPQFGLAAWQLASSPTGSATVAARPGQTEPTLSIYATPGAHDVLATKYLLLSPGTYRLSQAIDLTSAGGQAGAIWQVTCPGVRDLWRSLPLVAAAGLKSGGTFTIPADCPAQQLDLVVNVPLSQSSVELAIRAVSLERVRSQGG